MLDNEIIIIIKHISKSYNLSESDNYVLYINNKYNIIIKKVFKTKYIYLKIALHQ